MIPADHGSPLLANSYELSSAAAPPQQDMVASAPPPPSVMETDEFAALLTSFKSQSELPFATTLQAFRVATCNKLLWTAQVRELAAAVEGGAHLMRETYERQMLLDPQNLTEADGVQDILDAMAGGVAEMRAMQATQAMLSSLTVIRYDGQVTTVSVDLATGRVSDVMQLAAERLEGKKGGLEFDPAKHKVYALGTPVTATLTVGSYVKVTGLTQQEHLNGHMGFITQLDQDSYDVALSSGAMCLHKDNVVLHSTTVVVRSSSWLLVPGGLLADAGVAAYTRLLWLEKPEELQVGARVSEFHTGAGPLRAIRCQFVGMDMSQDGRVSAGELRSFLWNLHLSDEDFKKVKQRFCTKKMPSYMDLEDIMFLLGRPHLQNPGVPIDALMYEAVVSILGRGTTAHVDKNLEEADKGVGCWRACSDHCLSYTTSLVLQSIVFFNVVYFLARSIFFDLGIRLPFEFRPDDEPVLLGVCATSYILYLIHLCCGVGLTKAFNNETEGMEKVCHLMEIPRDEDPQYNWHVQCYHYVTVHYTTRDKDGRTSHHTRQERHNTHSASASGIIPSEDFTPSFLPQVEAQQTQIDTHLNLDLSRSNYYMEFNRWCAFHRRDTYQDTSSKEDLPSRAHSCLAVWVAKTKPCWMNATCYWFANIFLLSFFYRLAAQRLMGKQEYTYHKRCFDVGSRALRRH